MRVNREIRALKVRVITEDGIQLGVLDFHDALAKAREVDLDLVEISPKATPPVCKIIDYGKFRYQQSKREKVSKKTTNRTKLKEIKVKVNIDDHDLEFKINNAKKFIGKGCKVRFTCMFRGREIVFVDNGKIILNKIQVSLQDVAVLEDSPKMTGKILSMVMSPKAKKDKQNNKEKKSAESEDK